MSLAIEELTVSFRALLVLEQHANNDLLTLEGCL